MVQTNKLGMALFEDLAKRVASLHLVSQTVLGGQNNMVQTNKLSLVYDLALWSVVDKCFALLLNLLWGPNSEETTLQFSFIHAITIKQ